MTRTFLLAAAVGGCFALAGCGSGGAGGGTVNDAVTMISDTVRTASSVRAAPAGTTNWSQNLLGNQHLMPLQSRQVVVVRPESQCLYDFTIETQDGTINVPGQDLCRHDAVHFRPAG